VNGKVAFPDVRIEYANQEMEISRGDPNKLYLQGERSISLSYSGAPAAVQALASSQLKALSLAAGDLDGDGVEDLVAGYASAHGGVLVIHRGKLLRLLRLSRWDTTAFERLFPVLARQIRTATAGREDLRRAVLLAWAKHFPLSPSDNTLAFYCGVILLELRFFEEGSLLFKQSQDLLGRSATTSYNLGLCALGLGAPLKRLLWWPRPAIWIRGSSRRDSCAANLRTSKPRGRTPWRMVIRSSRESSMVRAGSPSPFFRKCSF